MGVTLGFALVCVGGRRLLAYILIANALKVCGSDRIAANPSHNIKHIFTVRAPSLFSSYYHLPCFS